uniref:Putative oxidoreductase yhhX n=1 Tax=Lygus hesperus TaxID=30085 RepID=A0A0A9WGE6_LYGHE
MLGGANRLSHGGLSSSCFTSSSSSCASSAASRKRIMHNVGVQVHSFIRHPCPVAFVHYAAKIHSTVTVKLDCVLSDYNVTLLLVSPDVDRHYDHGEKKHGKQ